MTGSSGSARSLALCLLLSACASGYQFIVSTLVLPKEGIRSATYAVRVERDIAFDHIRWREARLRCLPAADRRTHAYDPGAHSVQQGLQKRSCGGGHRAFPGHARLHRGDPGHPRALQVRRRVLSAAPRATPAKSPLICGLPACSSVKATAYALKLAAATIPATTVTRTLGATFRPSARLS